MSTAYFLANTKINHEMDVINEARSILRQEDIPHEIQGVFGVYDVVIKVSAKDSKTLQTIIQEKLRRITSVESSITMVVDEGAKLDA